LVLEQVGLAHRSRALPSQLSGGEAVRAGLAVALANDPGVVVADEPTGELDSETEQRVLAVMRERTAEGGAVVVATHSDAVASAADRVVQLVDGRVMS
jgi:putative ABC transport system ATP-binding protein